MFHCRSDLLSPSGSLCCRVQKQIGKVDFFNAAHSVVVCSRKNIGKRKIDAVHSPRPCSTNARHEVHSTTFGKIYVPQKKPCSALAHLMTCGIPSEAVRSSFPVREKIRLNKKKPCSALAHLMQCGILSEAMRSSVRCSKYDDFGLAKNRVSAFR